MKNFELRKIINEYKEIQTKISKTKKPEKLNERLAILERAYYHETGISIRESLGS